MSAKSTAREPWVRISKRGEALPRLKAWGIRLLSLLLSLVICSVLIVAIVHLSPLKVYASMVEGAFGTGKRAWVTVRDAMTMLCIAVGLAPAFKMKFWNIGAEGQILVGGIATSACMLCFKNLPTPIFFFLMIITSLVAGAVWGIIPGVFKARWNTNETLFTLMMNYIAIQLTSYCVSLWEHPFGSNTVGVINQKNMKGWLPNLFSSGYNGDFGWNVLLVMAITIGMYLYLSKSKHGYEISVIGDSENTARYAGIRVNWVYIRTMALSGALCAFAGFIAVSGASHTISTSMAGGRGFTAIIVAWLSQFNAAVMVVFSFLLIFLQKGAVQIASQFGLNESSLASSCFFCWAVSSLSTITSN